MEKHQRIERNADEQIERNECNIQTLEKLNLSDLIDAVETNKGCFKVASEIFQQKYANKTLKIERYPQQYDPNSMEIISDSITALNLIKHFGTLIKRLSIQINYDDTLCTPAQVIETIILLLGVNERCRESLVEFELHYSGCDVNNIFQQITGPFENVEKLSLHLFNMNAQQSEHPTQLNTIFPNLQDLNIDFHHVQDSSFIDCEFSKLKKLGISDGLIYESNESILIDLLKKNPQITYISLVRPTLRALSRINEYLLHLEDLHIVMERQEEYRFSKIKFPTVKRLNLWLLTEKCYPPKKIGFGTALREIDLLCTTGDISDNYVNFFYKYPKIEKLSAGRGMNNAHLLQMIGKFPKLQYVLFDFAKDVQLNNIIEFIKKSPSLNRLIFVHASIENVDSFVNQLKREFDADFKIESYDDVAPPSKRFSIERKIPIVNEPDDVADNAACSHNSLVRNAIFMLLIVVYFGHSLAF